jgi:hypothetical protein
MLDRVNDLITYRIDSVFDEISNMSLCELPDDEPMSPDEFLKQTQVDINHFLQENFSFFPLFFSLVSL